MKPRRSYLMQSMLQVLTPNYRQHSFGVSIERDPRVENSFYGFSRHRLLCSNDSVIQHTRILGHPISPAHVPGTV